MHTVIVGNGILALTTAFRLARRAGQHDRITLLGPRARPGSATLAAGAMLNLFAEIEAHSLDSEPARFLFELSHLASQMWPRFEHALIDAGVPYLPQGCADCRGVAGGGCFSQGSYVIKNPAGDGLDEENFAEILTALQDFNQSHALVSPGDIPNYQPEPHQRATAAVLIHGEGWFNPRLMLEKLEAILVRFPQVRQLDVELDRLLPSASGLIQSALCRDGTMIEADQFLLAAGASCGTILQRSALELEVQAIFYGVGVTLEIKSPAFAHSHAIRTPNRGLAGGLYTLPYFYRPGIPNDHVLIGASNQVMPLPVSYGSAGVVERLLRSAREQINLNFAEAQLVRSNLGWRPVSQDCYPLLGRTRVPNLLLASGTRRDGFHLSPLLSEVLVAMLYHEPVDPRWQMFAPERPPTHDLSREVAIDKALRQRLCAARQHAPDLPLSAVQRERDDLVRLHDQVGALDWGIPPEMLEMYRQGHALV